MLEVPSRALLVLAVLVTGVFTPAARVFAAEPAVARVAAAEQIKAAYLLKFAGFVEWPAGSWANERSPLLIAVAGAPAVLAELRRITHGRQVLGRAVELREIGTKPPAEPIHIVYIGAEAGPEGPRLLKEFRALPTVTVCDADTGLPAGAMLEFVMDGPRVRFQASVPAAEAAGLKLGAGLLNVALRVKGTSSP